MDPPPDLDIYLVEEILFRVPPDDPGLLVRASAVCKRWRLLVSDPGFRRRFCEFHRMSPNLGAPLGDTTQRQGFRFIIPTSSFRTRQSSDSHGWSVLDTRHGRALLRIEHSLAVWDSSMRELTELPFLDWSFISMSWNAAVLCAAAAGGSCCDHRHCHFLVVVVGRGDRGLLSHAYSSETGAWSEKSSDHRPVYCIREAPIALAGNALYFEIESYDSLDRILEYNLGTKETALIPLPPATMNEQQIALTTSDHGHLVLARLEESTLKLWSRKPCPLGGDAQWTQIRVVFPYMSLSGISPYTSFLYPELEVASTVEGPTADASSA